MKKILLLLCTLVFSLSFPAFAEVNSIHEEKTNWNITYPVISIPEHPSAQNILLTKKY